jgi:oxygen-independent coproporphyrinogen-3 oxidase
MIKEANSHSVYIHIPFCRRRCYYCNFNIVTIGDSHKAQEDASMEYTNILKREIKSTLLSTKDSYSSGIFTSLSSSSSKLDTIYFGGGTPSLMSINCLKDILQTLDNDIGINKNAEITLEMDPGTFDRTKLLQLKDIGINRISLGVQSFDDDILRKCGRAHTNKDTLNALSVLNDCGFENYSIDLISSLPYLTLDAWYNTLQKAKGSGCSHISVYDLQVEDNTAFGRWYKPGIFPMPSDEVSAEMYKLAVKELTKADYEHYEVSNYAKDGKRSRHNQKYWNLQPFYGFGLGAASFLYDKRITRPSKMADYKKWIESIENEGYKNSVPISIDSDEQINSVDILDFIMLSLRTKDGLKLEQLSERYGLDKTEKVFRSLEPYITNNLVVCDDKQNVRLSDPEGFMLSNEVISSVFAALD